MQNGLPLDEARGRHLGRELLLEVDLFPGTPVAVGIVDVATAGEDFIAAGAADFQASPLGEISGVEDVAFVRAFRNGSRREQEHLAEITGGREDTALGSTGKGGNLVGAG